VATLLRAVRSGTGVAVVVALVAQYANGSDRATFSAANFFSYFTVISNILVAVVLLSLAARPMLVDEPRFELLRGTVTLCISATGLVYAVLLAPAAADVDVTLKWVDFIVHTLAPIVGFADWIVDPPRRRPTLAAAATWLVIPLVWLVYTMIRGPIVDWYPYPFLDPDLESAASIIVTCIGITVVFCLFAAGLRWWAGRRGIASSAAPVTV
jgi:hypothetical protein